MLAACPGAQPIAEVRDLPPGTKVTARGVVSVPTGVFTAGRSFAIQDTTGGIYVYRQAGIGQKLGLGDQVCVTGWLALYHGLLELTPGSTLQVVRLGSGEPPEPRPVDSAQVGESTEGMLVSVTGPASDVVENRFCVGSSTVYLNASTGITTEGLLEGCSVTVVGLSADYDGAQIWPRSQADIIPLQCTPTRCTGLTIAQIQGGGITSPYDGQQDLGCLTGCVTGVGAKGFYIQSAVPDGDPLTSEGLFVFRYAGWTNPVGIQPGDLVEIRNFGVQEFYGSTEIIGLRDDTRVSYRRVGTCPLPDPVPIPVLTDPQTDPESVYERFEGMRVTVGLDGAVTGPTMRYPSRFPAGEPELALVAAASPLFGQRILAGEMPQGRGMIYLSGGLDRDLPDVGTGDRLRGRDLTGILAYQFGRYVYLLDQEAPAISVQEIPRRSDATVRISRDEFAICTFNLENLFDAVDDGDGDMGDWTPGDAQAFDLLIDKRAAAIREDLKLCTVVGVQEVEGKDSVWQALVSAIGGKFRFDYFESPDERDITVGILYDANRVTLQASEQIQACTSTDYGVDYRWAVGPRSRPNPCGHLSTLGSYPLFDRPPYVADLTIHNEQQTQARDVRVIVNHFKSKSGDETVNLPQRIAQARHVAGLLNFAPAAESRVGGGEDARSPALLAGGLRLVAALGDFNDLPGSAPLRQFAGYTSLMDARVPSANRYTFIYDGLSQAVDHFIMTPGLDRYFKSGSPVHINADYPDRRVPDRTSRRSSDHDPVMVRFAFRPTGVSEALAGLATGAATGLAHR
jgi:hypothetical protein